MKKRILSVLLVLCMVICMAPATALASDDDSVMDMKVSDLIQGDHSYSLYSYWVHTNGTKTTFTEKDSIELEDGTKVSPSEGQWLIQDDRYMLGGIPDDKVKVYITPKEELLRVKAGVAGKGGSITPTGKYYLASDTDEKEYTVAPNPGYKVDKVEYTNAEETTGNVQLNQSTGNYVIYPSELSQDMAGAALRTADVKAYFKAEHTHCICGGETFDGHETHTAELDWVPWTSTTSLPDEAGNYFLQDNVTLPSGKVTLPDGVNLCLNGKSVTGEDASGTKLAVTGRGKFSFFRTES